MNSFGKISSTLYKSIYVENLRTSKLVNFTHLTSINFHLCLSLRFFYELLVFILKSNLGGSFSASFKGGFLEAKVSAEMASKAKEKYKDIRFTYFLLVFIIKHH